MNTSTFPPFLVSAIYASRSFGNSAGSARQAMAIAREELEAGAHRVCIDAAECWPQLLESFASLAEGLTKVFVFADALPEEGPYQFRVTFEPKDLALVVALEGVAPITPTARLVGRIPEGARRC